MFLPSIRTVAKIIFHMILERNTVPKNVLSFSSSSLYSKYSLLTTA